MNEIKSDVIRRRAVYKLKLKYKSKIPDFLRYDWDKYYRLERQERWRRTRGQDNKTRLRVKGFPKPAGVGFRKPKSIRYLHPSGLREVLIKSEKDLDSLNQKADVIVRLSSSLGLKKRLEIIKKAKEMGLRVCGE
ncbi:50S ribosomal protein L32e [Metallosphaera tengchongensis]|uniref:Large ribosomal subunit protein eL32 n=1 Tax=Metallosphaera tengchongensis TaxID=1532350 RepID=A0A6N0NX49_9CREN|nr:50S ribosomal protein L32e [Metallosphaera tengchongensis]QKQ99937.1 50S ribosomal protein L32e [Metallosphaera tengchongensis]